MNTACPECGTSFEPEPGFYFGAMFVSYAFNVALLLAIWLVLYLFWNPGDGVYIAAITLGAILFTPLFFRFSRVLWLHTFGGIEPRQPD